MAYSLLSGAVNTNITGGTFNVTGNDSGLKTILEHSATAALHNSIQRTDPPKCHIRTRVAINKRIDAWAAQSEHSEDINASMMWIYGPAGAGKSAICQSACERYFERGELLAGFFFSRTDGTRNSASMLMATIAYQTATSVPATKAYFEALVKEDPSVFTKSLEYQAVKLIAEPILSCMPGTYPTVVVIDGLDECVQPAERRSILLSIVHILKQHHVPLRFLFSSRFYPDIVDVFNNSAVAEIHKRLVLSDDYQSYKDVMAYLKDMFEEIKTEHIFKASIPEDWPANGALSVLAGKSSGQFIYASTVIKYLKDPRDRPHIRLDVVLGLKAARGKTKPFAELDALYHHILMSAEYKEEVMNIISARLFTRHYLRHAAGWLNGIFGYSMEDAEVFLGDVSCLVQLGDPPLDVYESTGCMQGCSHDCNIDAEYQAILGEIMLSSLGPGHALSPTQVNILHASLAEFLLDPERSGSLYLNEPVQQAMFAERLAVKIGLFRRAVGSDEHSTSDMQPPLVKAAAGLSFFIHQGNYSGPLLVSPAQLGPSKYFPRKSMPSQSAHIYKQKFLQGALSSDDTISRWKANGDAYGAAYAVTHLPYHLSRAHPSSSLISALECVSVESMFELMATPQEESGPFDYTKFRGVWRFLRALRNIVSFFRCLECMSIAELIDNDFLKLQGTPHLHIYTEKRQHLVDHCARLYDMQPEANTIRQIIDDLDPDKNWFHSQLLRLGNGITSWSKERADGFLNVTQYIKMSGMALRFGPFRFYRDLIALFTEKPYEKRMSAGEFAISAVCFGYYVFYESWSYGKDCVWEVIDVCLSVITAMLPCARPHPKLLEVIERALMRNQAVAEAATEAKSTRWPYDPERIQQVLTDGFAVLDVYRTRVEALTSSKRSHDNSDSEFWSRISWKNVPKIVMNGPDVPVDSETETRSQRCICM